MSRPSRRSSRAALIARANSNQNGVDIVKLRAQFESLQDRVDLIDARVDATDTRADDHEDRITALEEA